MPVSDAIAAALREIGRLRGRLDALEEALRRVARPAVAAVSADPLMAEVERVGRAVAGALGVEWQLLVGPTRSQAVAWPRMLAMSIARRATRAPLRCIGAVFGGRHHAAVLHALACVRARIHQELDSGRIEAGMGADARLFARAAFAAAAARIRGK